MMVQIGGAHDIRLDRIILRVIEHSDAPDLLRLYSSQQVTQYLPIHLSTLAQAEALAADLRRSWAIHGFGMWAILDARDMRFIGRCGFFERPSSDPTMPTKELAYLLDDAYWGKGLATECARACLRYGFTIKHFESIYAITRTENVASRRVMEKIHMVYRPREPFTSLGKVFFSLNRAEYVPTQQTFELRSVTLDGMVNSP